MGLTDRAKNIIVSPKTEWPVIAAETTPAAQLVMGYVLPLAAISAIAGFIGTSLVGISTPFTGTFRMPITWGLAAACYQLVASVVGVYVLAFIIDALAPTFAATKGFAQALKVAVYAYTPVWVAGVVRIVPLLGVLVLIAALYAIYLLYLGLQSVMRAPQEKAAGYTAVVIIAAIVIAVVIGAISGFIFASGMGGGGLMSRTMPSGPMVAEPGSPAARLQEFGRKMEEANKRMEAAQKSGDAGKQVESALGALGTVMSGGKGVDPVQLDQLKPFLPEQFASLPRTDLNADRSGVQGFTTARVAGTYRNEGRSVDLEVTDTGGAAGLLALAGWAGLQGEHENAERREVTRQEGERIVHERASKTGGTNEYTVILARRFVVSAKGHGVDVDTLKSGVAAVDLARLEALK